jgi:WD40 repeat protein
MLQNEMNKSTKHNQYEYLAFISYQRKDEAIAKRLQHTLEFYNLPIAVVEKEPRLKDGIRPIFVDMTELGDEPFLEPAIKKALKVSRFLIVICSPKSAKSKWVNKEVQYFLQRKRTKHIIPFIIEGTPNSQLKDEECCTPLLKKLLGQRELLGININEMGFDAAAVKVVSRMFHIGFRTLWNRYEKEKEEEQRKLKEQNDRLLIAQSRFIAEKANELVQKGDSYTARKLLLEVLPCDEKPDIPLTIESELALREAVKHNNAIIVGHTGQVNSVSFSPDGRRIVSASDDNTIRIWNVFTGKQIGDPLVGHTAGVKFASFSPNGKLIVSFSNDNSIRLWDATKGEQIGEPLVTHVTRTMPCIQGNDENTDFFSFMEKESGGSATVDTNVNQFEDIVSNVSTVERLVSYIASVNSVSFSPDGNKIVSASENEIRIWDVATHKQIGEPLIGHTDTVNSVLYDSVGKRIISASDDKSIRIWDSCTGKQLGEAFIGHKNGVKFASFSPNGKEFVSTSWDGTIRIWNILKGEHFKIRQSMVDYAIFSPNGENILSAGATVIFYDIKTRKKIKEFVGVKASLSKDGKFVVSAYYDNDIRLSELYTIKIKTRNIGGHCRKAFYAIYSPDGKKIVSATSNKFLMIWNAETGIHIKSLKFKSIHVSHMSFNTDGNLLIISSWGLSIDVWDLKNERMMVYCRHSTSISSAIFSPDGKNIVSASMDGVIKVWDYYTGEQIGESMNAYTHRVYSHVFVAYNPDGSQFLSSAGDGTIRIWNPITCKQIGNSIEGFAANYSSDGKYMVSANRDSIKIWEVSTRKQIRSFTTKEKFGTVTTISFSPNGKYVLSATDNGEIIIWDVITGSIIEDWFVDYENTVCSVVFSPDGRSILSASENGSIQICEFPSLVELISDTYERFKSHPLTAVEKKKYYLE